jgi:hypothetical protein
VLIQLPEKSYLRRERKSPSAMPKRGRKRSTVRGLTTTDWARFSPYSNFTEYDGYYLKLANAFFAVINDPAYGLRELIQRPERKQLAVQLARYVEDCLNQIGLWQAMTQTYEQRHGAPLPFYELKEYEPGELNPEDFMYLLWHVLTRASGYIVDAHQPILEHTAWTCYDLVFDTVAEGMPVTGFYDDFLRIDPDIPFFELKERLQWMAFKSYLAGSELRPKFEEEMKDQLAKFDGPDKEKVAYSLQDDFLYNIPTSWGGLSVPEWMAAAARCPDDLRDDIRRLHRRVIGTFTYEGQDEHSYYFRYTPTGRLFPVQRASVDLEEQHTQPDHQALFQIINWRGGWWLSGSFMVFENDEGGAAQPKNAVEAGAGTSFYGWSEDDQATILKHAAGMEEDFLEFFGSRMVLFDNGPAMAEGLQKHQQWFNDKIRKGMGQDPAPGDESSDFSIDYPGQEPVGLFYEPDEGITIHPGLPELVKLMQKRDLSMKERSEIVQSLLTGLSPNLSRHLAAEYGLESIVHPKSSYAGSITRHFDFLLDFFQPESLQPVTPNLGLTQTPPPS